jgi:hypothetical protein
VEARRLADEHDVRVRASEPDDLRAALRERAGVQVAVSSACARSAAARSTASMEASLASRGWSFERRDLKGGG